MINFDSINFSSWENQMLNNKESGGKAKEPKLRRISKEGAWQNKCLQEKTNQTTFKAKHREATARWRESKREKEKESNSSLVQSPMIVDVSLMSKQRLGKAMKKVKNALPQSPRRKKVVVRVLVASLDLIQQKRKTSHGLEQYHIDTVQAFYRQEDILWFMPGKQDVVTIWDENGDKHKEQKRILTMAIGEVYSLFVDEYPNVTIGKSKFAKLTLKEVLLSSKTLMKKLTEV